MYTPDKAASKKMEMVCARRSNDVDGSNRLAWLSQWFRNVDHGSWRAARTAGISVAILAVISSSTTETP